MSDYIEIVEIAYKRINFLVKAFDELVKYPFWIFLMRFCKFGMTGDEGVRGCSARFFRAWYVGAIHFEINDAQPFTR
ncbi:hypothetical protein ASG60_09680 [Methylobacterium sp. Leaf469]|nr:hypothetical protein ASG60_09680 [Methylobacterium sp. Leaf469]